MPRGSTVRYTYADYLSIPEDTSRRYEIVDGALFVTAAPRARHQEVAGKIFRVLAELAETHRLGKTFPGPMTVHLHDELVVEPDVLFVRADRLEIVDPDGGVEGPPDLVVEVLSPSNQTYDRNLKRKHYLENGVGELWIVDADEGTLEVWTPGATEPESIQDALVWLVGDRRFRIPLSDLFPA